MPTAAIVMIGGEPRVHVRDDIVKIVENCPEGLDCCVIVSCRVTRDEGDTADGAFLKITTRFNNVIAAKFEGTNIVAYGPSDAVDFDTEETSGSYDVALVFSREHCGGDDILDSSVKYKITVQLLVDNEFIGSWEEREDRLDIIEAGNFDATTGTTARSISEVRASSSLACLIDPACDDFAADCSGLCVDLTPFGEGALAERFANAWDSVTGGGTVTDGTLRLDGADIAGGTKTLNSGLNLGCCFFRAVLTVTVEGFDTRGGCGTTFAGTKTVCSRHNYCNGIAQGSVVEAWWSSASVAPYQVNDLTDVVICSTPSDVISGHINATVTATDPNNAIGTTGAHIVVGTSISLTACPSDCGVGFSEGESMSFEIPSPEEQQGSYSHEFEFGDSGGDHYIKVTAVAVIERETIPC